MSERSVMVADVFPAGYGGTHVVTDKEAQDAFFEFCRAPHGERSKGIVRVYLATGWHGFDRVSADDQALKAFNVRAHEEGMRVFNLQGHKGWALPDSSENGVRIIDQVLRFNKNAKTDERFDGILLDIEPHKLSGAKRDPRDWKKHEREIWWNYLGVVDRIGKRVARYNKSAKRPILLGECLPSIYPKVGRGGRAGFVDVMDRVDFVWLICRRDNAGRIIEDVQDEILHAEKVGKQVVLGLCVDEPDEATGIRGEATFWDEGRAAMQGAIEKVRQRFEKNGRLREVSVSSYTHYKGMKP